MEFDRSEQQFPIDSRKKSKAKTILLAGFLLALLLLCGYIFFRSKINSALKANAPQRLFVVERGQSAAAVGGQLYQQGFISSGLVFDVYVFFKGDRGKIQAGQYVLSASMNIRQILTELVSGNAKAQFEVVQVIDGWDIDDITAYLQAKNIAQPAAFIVAERQIATEKIFNQALPDRSLEGYLFPDTYFIKPGSESQVLIRRMLDNLSAKLTSQIRTDIQAQGKTIYDILTMASIVQKEVGGAADQKIVAGIFYNRLKLGMPLQSDATISFITKNHSAQASSADLQIDSPYNTYKYAGLPPGPISNPGISAILAAVYPSATDYLYFLTKPDGTVVYAKTYDQQIANKQKYLK